MIKKHRINKSMFIKIFICKIKVKKTKAYSPGTYTFKFFFIVDVLH